MVDVSIKNPAFTYLINLEHLSLRRLSCGPSTILETDGHPFMVWPDKIKTLYISAGSYLSHSSLYKWLFLTNIKGKAFLEQVHVDLVLRTSDHDAAKRNLPSFDNTIVESLTDIGLHLFKSLFFIITGHRQWE